MGKASSSKKVARAAKAGGSTRTAEKRELAFPLLIATLVVVGIVGVVLARDSRDAIAAPRIGEDHWHDTYVVDICGDVQAPYSDAEADLAGIHTHGNGLIHIHPRSGQAEGKNAKLGVWAPVVGLDFGDDSITLPDGTTLTNGDACPNAAEGDDASDNRWRVVKWNDATSPQRPDVVDTDFGDVLFDQDGQAITIYFGPDDDLDIEPPAGPAIDELDAVGPELDANVVNPDLLDGDGNITIEGGEGTVTVGEDPAEGDDAEGDPAEGDPAEGDDAEGDAETTETTAVPDTTEAPAE